MGPHGKWFDFACEPKNPKKRFNRNTGLPQKLGPVHAWPGDHTMTLILPRMLTPIDKNRIIVTKNRIIAS